MDRTEIARVQLYLRQKFGTERLRLVQSRQDPDSAEMLMGEEFLGVVFRDDEEGELSYNLHMAILEMDLPQN